jgi:hypothetical protein
MVSGVRFSKIQYYISKIRYKNTLIFFHRRNFKRGRSGAYLESRNIPHLKQRAISLNNGARWITVTGAHQRRHHGYRSSLPSPSPPPRTLARPRFSDPPQIRRPEAEGEHDGRVQAVTDAGAAPCDGAPAGRRRWRVRVGGRRGEAAAGRACPQLRGQAAAPRDRGTPARRARRGPRVRRARALPEHAAPGPSRLFSEDPGASFFSCSRECRRCW